MFDELMLFAFILIVLDFHYNFDIVSLVKSEDQKQNAFLNKLQNCITFTSRQEAQCYHYGCSKSSLNDINI